MSQNLSVEVVIIGGNFAGLAAAMPLVRGRRKVLVLDTKKPRNRFAHASHGVFGLDGKSPAEIQTQALSQLQQYPTFKYKEDKAITVEKTETGFTVTTETGQRYGAQKIILAFGIIDQLPDIPGVNTFWGKSVIHCPYCHGYELSGGPLGVLATKDISWHQAAMLPDWGVTTFFTQGHHSPTVEQAEMLQRRGVTVEQTPIVEIIGKGDQVSAVKLEDGRLVTLKGVYIAPTITADSPLIDSLGLSLEQTPIATLVKVDESKESSVKGVFVAGDLSNPLQNGTFAIASGTLAGVSAHRALMFD